MRGSTTTATVLQEKPCLTAVDARAAAVEQGREASVDENQTVTDLCDLTKSGIGQSRLPPLPRAVEVGVDGEAEAKEIEDVGSDHQDSDRSVIGFHAVIQIASASASWPGVVHRTVVTATRHVRTQSSLLAHVACEESHNQHADRQHGAEGQEGDEDDRKIGVSLTPIAAEETISAGVAGAISVVVGHVLEVTGQVYGDRKQENNEASDVGFVTCANSPRFEHAADDNTALERHRDVEPVAIADQHVADWIPVKRQRSARLSGSEKTPSVKLFE